ncbi:MAG: pyridoxal phosphate-dependent aminotransferase [Synergistaceae bacterium]|nr:pyridoxal phosphate-dependent aminotransferase [Synergistaceae bacterium]
MKIADRSRKLSGEGAFEVLARVQALEAQGRRIVSFAIGEPDFDTEDHVKEAGIRAIRDGVTHYTPTGGTVAFREAVARFLRRERGVTVEASQIVVTPGVKPVLFCAILSCVDAGQEVIVPSPGFPAYESLVHYAGATPVLLPLREERDFVVDPDELESLVTDRTAMILLNSPHNPTGSVIPRQTLERIGAIAKKHDLWVLSDEVYASMVYEGDFVSALAVENLADRTVIVDGFSKTFAMTGWRLGFGVMPSCLVEPFTTLLTNSVSCTAAFTQVAGIAALDGPQEGVAAMTASYRRRRDLLAEGLNALPGLTCRPSRGAFYLFANVTEACRRLKLPSAEALQKRLLDEAGVAVLARNCFGTPYEGERGEFIRFCYATSEAEIGEGLKRLKDFFASAS